MNKAVPDESYAIDYVYGYRSADSRQNVYFNKGGCATYMTACLGVILDTDSNTQKYFGGGEVKDARRSKLNNEMGHNDDILGLAISPCRGMAATGQRGNMPSIFTWDTATGEKKMFHQLPKGARGINALSISADGKMIAAVDQTNDHNLIVLDAETGALKFKMKGDANKIYDCAFSAKDGDCRIGTVGVRHCYFWDINAESGKQKKKGIKAPDQCSHSCIASDTEGRFLTGAQNGSVFVWADNEYVCHTKAHNGYVSSIRCVDGKLYTGGKDGCVKSWTIESDGKLTAGQEWSFSSMVRAIDCMDDKMLIGTRDGTITLMCGGDQAGAKEVMHSHNDGEVWGLCSKDQNVLTTGDDNQCIEWNPAGRCRVESKAISSRSANSKKGKASTLSNKPASQCARGVAYNAGTTVVACNDGVVHVHGTCEKKLEDADEWIECVAFSPDASMLAVGGHDNMIRVYNTSDYSLVGCCKGHSSYIMAMDWSADGKWIRSNCGAYELLFFCIPDCKQDPSGKTNTKAVVWATKTIKFSWHVNGIYPKGEDGTHINRVAGSADGCLLATGDDFTLMRIFRDPCVQGSQPRSYRGHSEHVTNVIFH